ncbi:MAG: TPM domain-containing protein [Candidatus Omnitrophica bacterium]|nr:TPM domain-containing protein [Candidatus Omnitrophota bacterium]
MKNKSFCLITCIALSFILFARPGICQTENLPDYTGYVNDYANILSYETKSTLSALMNNLEQKTTAQVAIVTIDTTKPLDIETYAVELFEKWGIGQKGKDNGVLLVIAMKDKTMRIEVGYGLEGAIPDALAKIIIEDYIVPSFKNSDFNTGILKGAVGIAKLVAKEYNIELNELGELPVNVPLPEEPSPLESFINFIFTLVIIILFISLRMGFFWWWFLIPGSYRRRGGYWHGGGYRGNSGGFGGGFGGFGGGLSGGGGASGGW